jgi:hypothetical protein
MKCSAVVVVLAIIWGCAKQPANPASVTPPSVKPPSAPTLSSPSDGAAGEPVTPAFTWNDVFGAASYRLQVSTDSAFASPVANDSGLTSTTRTLAAPLVNAMKYYWRVNAANIGGTSGWSAVWSFTTGPVAAWSALGTGINSVTTALAIDGSGNLYAGADGVVGKWNGSSWSVLGTGMSGGGAYGSNIGALAIDLSGNVYAGGIFTTAGGVPANHIARWDGTAWSAMGSGMSDIVMALAIDGSGNLYAGGFFATAGGVTAHCIAKWDGSSWSPLGTGFGRFGNGIYISALATDGSGNLYAGGYFDTAGGVPARNIAKWNGSSWSSLGTGLGPSGGLTVASALAFDGSGNLYVGGFFSTAGGVAMNNVARWNGSAWSALGTGISYRAVHALAIDGSGNLYAGGEFTAAGGVAANYVARWDGSAWSALGSGMSFGSGTPCTVHALVSDASGTLYAGGYFNTAGGVLVNYVARWK